MQELGVGGSGEGVRSQGLESRGEGAPQPPPPPPRVPRRHLRVGLSVWDSGVVQVWIWDSGLQGCLTYKKTQHPWTLP